MLDDRWWRWCALSGALLAIVFAEVMAADQRRSGFETFMAIAGSKPRLLVVCNALLAVSVTIAAFVAGLLFGTLRRTETEYLSERCRVGLLEFFLTLAMFRHTMTWRFGAAVFLLLVCKVFHWMARGRVQWLSAGLSLQRPSVVMHLRNVSTLALLAVADAAALRLTWGEGALVWPPPATSLLFLFHYAALVVSLVVTTAEYMLSAAPDRCHGKGTATLAVSLAGEALQLLVYAGLLAAVWALHNTPPFMLLSQVLDGTQQVFAKAVTLRKFWQLTDTNSRFMIDVLPPPVPEDGEPELCIVCREAMMEETGLKQLHCGHIYHGYCLNAWLQQQQACPTCKQPLEPVAETATHSAQQPQAGESHIDGAAGSDGPPTAAVDIQGAGD